LFYIKALANLTLCKNLATRSTGDSSDEDTRQTIRVLICLADSYCAVEDRDNALKYYQQALQYSQIINDDILASSVQAHLLGAKDGGSKGTRGFLIEALHLQGTASERTPKDPTEEEKKKAMDKSIKDEMVTLLRNLGLSNSLSSDIDLAIGCYSESVQAHGSEIEQGVESSNDIVDTMVSLGTLCQLKGCLKNEAVDVQACMKQAERYYDEANAMADRYSPVCVQYANFKYQQGDSFGAILTMLPFVFCSRASATEITYHGVEKAVLPNHLHKITEGEETLVLEARVFAKFLALLAYKQLAMSQEIDDVIVDMYKCVLHSSKPLNHVMLGYGLLELGLVEEAGLAFLRATELSTRTSESGEVMTTETNVTSCDTYWMCILLDIYRKLCRLLEYLHEYVNSNSFEPDQSNMNSSHTKLRRDQSKKERDARVKEDQPPQLSFTERLANIKADTEWMAKNASLPLDGVTETTTNRFGDQQSREFSTSNIESSSREGKHDHIPNPLSLCPSTNQIPERSVAVSSNTPHIAQRSDIFRSSSASSQSRQPSGPTTNISDRLLVIESRLKSQFNKTLTQSNTAPPVDQSKDNTNISVRPSSGFTRDITISVSARDKPSSDLKKRYDNSIASKENVDMDNAQWTTSEGVVETPREVLELLLNNEKIKRTNSFK